MKKLLVIASLLVPTLVLFGCNTKTTTKITTDNAIQTGIEHSGTATETTTINTTTTETWVMAPQGTYTMDEVAAHNTPALCWTTIDGIVYDLTAWINKHPGWDKNILQLCGLDGTMMFSRKHGNDMKPQEILKGFEIGTLSK